MNTNENIESLIKLGTVFEVPRGTVLFSAYEEVVSHKSLFVLIEGKCTLTSTSRRGKECIFFDFDKGDIMAYTPFLMHYYLDNASFDQYVDEGLYQIVAQTDAKVLRIPYTNCKKLIDDPGFQHMLIASIGKHMVSTSLSAQGSTVERLCGFLYRQVSLNGEGRMQIEPSLTYSKIASSLGMHPTTVADVMRGLIHEGTITRKGRCLFLENEIRLTSLAAGSEKLKYYEPKK